MTVPRTVADPLVLEASQGMLLVVRPFFADGARRYRGEIVNTENWRTTATLIERRYLAPLPYGASLDTKVEVDGIERTFINEETALKAVEDASKRTASDEPQDSPEEVSMDISAADLEDDGEPIEPPVREAPKNRASGKGK